jgi:hypothetical protein
MEEFTLGAGASCPDGFCGVVSGTIVDPATRTVTHLVIEPENGTKACTRSTARSGRWRGSW